MGMPRRQKHAKHTGEVGCGRLSAQAAKVKVGPDRVLDLPRSPAIGPDASSYIFALERNLVRKKSDLGGFLPKIWSVWGSDPPLNYRGSSLSSL